MLHNLKCLAADRRGLGDGAPRFQKRIHGILAQSMRHDVMAEADDREARADGRHGQGLMVLPELRSEWPDPDLLRQHYEQFKVSGASA